MLYVYIYLAVNIIPAWWFLANIGEKGSPTIGRQIRNMGTLFHVEGWWAVPIVFGMGSIFWILLFGSAFMSRRENLRREANRVVSEKKILDTRQQIIADWVADQQSKGRF